MKKSLSSVTSEKAAPENGLPKLPRGILKLENEKAELNVEFLKQQSIFIATPCYNGVVTDQYFLSMFKLSQELSKLGINFRITTLRNESLIPRARNILTAMFLEEKIWSHFLFIDADIEFNPESIILMLAADKDIVAGAYPKKTINWDKVRQAALNNEKDLASAGAEYAINFKPDKDGRLRTELNLVEVLDASTGFFLVKRNAITKMVAAHPELKYVNDSATDPKINDYCYALWDTMIDPDDSRYLSEDYTFCRRAQKLGIEVWIDVNVPLNHVGSFTFNGNIANIFSRHGR